MTPGRSCGPPVAARCRPAAQDRPAGGGRAGIVMGCCSRSLGRVLFILVLGHTGTLQVRELHKQTADHCYMAKGATLVPLHRSWHVLDYGPAQCNCSTQTSMQACLEVTGPTGGRQSSTDHAILTNPGFFATGSTTHSLRCSSTPDAAHVKHDGLSEFDVQCWALLSRALASSILKARTRLNLRPSSLAPRLRSGFQDVSNRQHPDNSLRSDFNVTCISSCRSEFANFNTSSNSYLSLVT